MHEPLKNCPFCGEAAKHSFNSLYGDMSMASCKSCGATAYAPKWNRRAVLAKWGQPAQAAEPVAWLDPWTGTKVTTDYDAYGKHGIPRYTAPQPSPTAQAAQAASVQEDAALWHWLAEYLVGPRTELDDEIVASETVNDLRKLVEAAIKQGEKQ